MTYTLIRARRRTISLAVERDGGLTVRAPLGMSRQQIDAFVAQKIPWLTAARERLRAEELSCPLPALEEGAVLPWLDGGLTLHLEPRRGAKREGERLLLPAANPSAALESWCRREARAELSDRVARWAPAVGVVPAGLKINGARTRWGSCTARNSLNFSWRLLLCPAAQVDYVVVHELCHILQKNHSPKFWALVERVLPDFRNRRKSLQKRRNVMDFL